MTPQAIYNQSRLDLNELMDFITTDEFIELPAAERRQHLQKLKQLLHVMAGEE